MAVVDALELIDVEKEDRDLAVAAAGARQLGLERVDAVGAVEAPGQRVAQPVLANVSEQLDVVQGDAEQRRRGADGAAAVRRGLRQGDAEHAADAAAAGDDVAHRAVSGDTVRLPQLLGRGVQHRVGNRLNRSRRPPCTRAIGDAFPFRVAANQHPQLGAVGERGKVAPDRLVDGFNRQRAAQRLAERHQLLELTGASAGQLRFVCRRVGLDAHLAAIGLDMENEHH